MKIYDSKIRDLLSTCYVEKKIKKLLRKCFNLPKTKQSRKKTGKAAI
jgi:hypothetical protein